MKGKKMNERIEELSKRAWEYADKYSRDGDGKHGGLYKYKFAELIVSECMKVAHYHTPDTDDLDYGWLIRNKIANHFGIPE
jgi:hypothetical protein